MTVIPKKWLRLPGEDETGYLQLSLVGGAQKIPLVAETKNVAAEDVTLEKEQEFYILLEAAEELQVYNDEDDYYAKSDTCFAAESLIPSDVFSPEEHALHLFGESLRHFEEPSQAIVQGRVLEIRPKGESEPSDEGVFFTIASLDYGFIVSCLEGTEKLKDLAPGNIVSGMFWVWGWPKESDR